MLDNNHDCDSNDDHRNNTNYDDDYVVFIAYAYIVMTTDIVVLSWSTEPIEQLITSTTNAMT